MDLSFSSDENGNSILFKVPAVPNATSTPHKNKKGTKRLVCPVCNKVYQLQHYYNLHVSSHTTPDTANNTQENPSDLNASTSIANVSHAIQLNDSDLSIVLPDDNNASTTFKVPKAPNKKKVGGKEKRKPTFTCTYCLKGYICHRSFKNHIRAHAIQDAAARFPDSAKILGNCGDISDAALLEVSKCVSVGESGQHFKELVGHIASIASEEKWEKFCEELCSDLIDSIKHKKCILPSPLAASLIERAEIINSSVDKSDALPNLLNISDLFECDVLSQFLLEFSLNLLTEILRFITKSFRDSYPRLRKVVAEPDKEDRQVIYYVAGSIMRGYLKIARRSVKSKTWKSVAAVLKTNILVDKPTGDTDPDSEWTKEVDRESLLYINTESQKFFVGLTVTVYGCEQGTGAIDYAEVITKVTQSMLSVEWSNIIGDSLPEIVSVNLMNDVIMSYSRTCARGSAKKRLNFLKNKPTVSMPTRHLVASRKNR